MGDSELSKQTNVLGAINKIRAEQRGRAWGRRRSKIGRDQGDFEGDVFKQKSKVKCDMQRSGRRAFQAEEVQVQRPRRGWPPGICSRIGMKATVIGISEQGKWWEEFRFRRGRKGPHHKGNAGH